MHWKFDKRFSDGYVGHVREILGQYKVRVGRKEEDAKFNTDLVVLSTDRGRMGLRVRRPLFRGFKETKDAFYEWGDQFTIRSARASGTPTELAKIMDGWGDWLLYGWAAFSVYVRPEPPLRLRAWGLGKLDAFRDWAKGQDLSKRRQTDNRDGTSFMYFRWREVPGFLAESHGLWHEGEPFHWYWEKKETPISSIPKKQFNQLALFEAEP